MANLQMELTRQSVYVIMSPMRAAHLNRWADEPGREAWIYEGTRLDPFRVILRWLAPFRPELRPRIWPYVEPRGHTPPMLGMRVCDAEED
jgi:hypothetical protein